MLNESHSLTNMSLVELTFIFVIPFDLLATMKGRVSS